MATLKIIEFFDPTGDIMVTKIPDEGSAEFVLGSQLIVQESQVAIFYKNGQALDGFKSGRHTLMTQNLPLLRKVIGLGFGGKSPFRTYVYFVATKTFVNLGWGTSNPILFRDKDFRMVSLRAYGSFGVRITKPRIFLNTLVGTRGMETTFAIEEYLRSMIVSRLNQVLGSTMESILDLPVLYTQISEDTKRAVAAHFEQYGIQLVDLLIEAITLPDDVQDMINRATGVAAQDVSAYQAISAADALRDAAQNPGTAGGAMGAGLGMGIGLGMSQKMTEALGEQKSTSEPASNDSGGTDIMGKLKQLKALHENDLISDKEYESKRAELLAKL